LQINPEDGGSFETAPLSSRGCLSTGLHAAGGDRSTRASVKQVRASGVEKRLMLAWLTGINPQTATLTGTDCTKLIRRGQARTAGMSNEPRGDAQMDSKAKGDVPKPK